MQMYGIYLRDKCMTWRVLFGQTESKLITKYCKSWNITRHLKWKPFPKGVQFELVQLLNICAPPPKKHLGILS